MVLVKSSKSNEKQPQRFNRTIKGAFESLGIQIGKDLTPAIRLGAHMLQGFVERFKSMPGWVRKVGNWVGAIRQQ